MDFNNLPEKRNIVEGETLLMALYKNVDGRKIAFKVPVSVFKSFYLNNSALDEISTRMESFRKEIEDIVKTIKDKEYIDAGYMTKEDAEYYRKKLLTADKLNSLLGDYCTREKIELDIQNCEEHARAVATAIGNNLALIASQTKTNAAMMQTTVNNSADITEAINNIELTVPESSGAGG